MSKSYSFTRKILVFFSLFVCNSAEAQSNISGSVQDSLNKRIENVNVILFNASDSGLVKGMLTDANGFFLFRNIKAGSYFIQSTYTGLNVNNSKAFTLSAGKDQDLGLIRLSEKAMQLEEVQVSVRKPLLEQKIDRLIINVANSITSAGSTALEILERSPGVIVDHQNNLISMNGKEGVVLMVNGKMSQLPIAAVVDMLSGMSSGNIEKIELITTPP
ncbi:MAG: carboxypeptidase-like regulatory domain-containing protein, partial [Chitinophagales bacterium]